MCFPHLKIHTNLNSCSYRLQMQPPEFSYPLGCGSNRGPRLQNAMHSNHQVSHDLDLGISAKENPTFNPQSHSASAAPCTASTPLPPPFTLHFTADIISQISAHLARILTEILTGWEKKVTPLVTDRHSIKHSLTN